MALAAPPEAAPRPSGPAAAAASRLARANTLLGLLGLASSVFVVVRLAERWRVTPSAASHHITLLGQTVSYPAANLAAVIVLLLGVVGLAVVVLAVTGALREFAASARFSRRMSLRGLTPSGRALVFEADRPEAFCAGLVRPRVYISSGAMAALDEPALLAVLMHEQHHAQRRDPLRLATARVLARALFYVPAAATLAAQHESLAELGADEHAIRAITDDGGSALARAMLAFAQDPNDGEPNGIDPLRVDHLLGAEPSWHFPVLLYMTAFILLAVLVAVALLAGQLANGSASLAPPFLSDRPCIVTLAMLPAAVGLTVLRLTARRHAS